MGLKKTVGEQRSWSHSHFSNSSLRDIQNVTHFMFVDGKLQYY
jgi:hypothetical protein